MMFALIMRTIAIVNLPFFIIWQRALVEHQLNKEQMQHHLCDLFLSLLIYLKSWSGEIYCFADNVLFFIIFFWFDILAKGGDA